MRGLLFDKDGTLLDFGASWSVAYRDLCLELSAGDQSAASAMLAAGGMDLETGSCRSGSVLAVGNTIDIARFWFPLLSEQDLKMLIARIDQTFFENSLRYSMVLPGVKEALSELAASGYAMGVATSDGTASSRAALAKLGLEPYLPHVFGYDSVPRPKPAPDMVHAFAAAISTEPKEVAVIGDNAHDLEMARSAGAGAAIGVLSGNSTHADLADLADVVLEGIRELPDWLRSRFSI
jgi:phosphoglycolate phosphatase